MPGPLQSLALENFRAFRGDSFNLKVEGQNALIFGENGSGKTSVWMALEATLAAAIAPNGYETRAQFAKHRYHWAGEESASVKIVLDGQTDPYVWRQAFNSSEVPIENDRFTAAANLRACMDYRALWETYFLQKHEEKVDIWPLLLDVLLKNHSNPSFGLQFGIFWQRFKLHTVESQKMDAQARADLEKELAELEAAVHEELEQIWIYAAAILKTLSPDIIFSFGNIRQPSDGTYQNVGRSKTLWQLQPPRVWLHVQKRDDGQWKDFPNHHNLLNEARLSALAIAIYLGAAKQREKRWEQANPGAPIWKVLALDDVLIGLDMSNRLPVLDVLKTYFKDWQIFLFTYDRAWYELAKARLNKDTWKKFEFYAGGEVPVWGEDCGALEKSKAYLQAARDLKVPDYKAAGVWARSAFEWMMKWFCDKYDVAVPYGVDDKFVSAETLWKTLQKVEVEIISNSVKTTRPLVREEIGDGVTRAKAQHLNPLCHANLNSFDAKEIADSLAALEALEIELCRDYESAKTPEQLRVEVEKIVVDFDALDGFSDSQLRNSKNRIYGEMRKRGLIE